MKDPTLDALIAQAKREYEAMTPAQREAMHAEQRAAIKPYRSGERQARAQRPRMVASPDTIPVPLKLLREAHAVMRAHGWHLATAAPQSDDGVIEAAASEIEEQFRALIDGAKGAQQ